MVREHLDPDTATTVTLLSRPVELIAETPMGMSGATSANTMAAAGLASSANAANSAQPDPFAYLAPFETDRSGQRELFLWIAPPAGAGPAGQAQLMCDAAPVPLTPLNADLGSMGLSHEPYASPAPWAEAWYFRIPEDALRCLAQARSIALQLPSPAGPMRFSAPAQHLAALAAFERR